MSSLAIIPHNDDETLFLAFTLMREKPLVLLMTDSYIQPNRGENGCSAAERRQETINACALLGCPVVFAGLRDDSLDKCGIEGVLSRFHGFDKVFAPAIQGGNAQHDLIGECVKKWRPDTVQYTTYTKTELYTEGAIEIKPSKIEQELKLKVLGCYPSQLNLRSTRPHFEAVVTGSGTKSEWYICEPY